MQDIRLRRHRGVYAAVWYDEAGHRQRRSLGTADRALANTRLAALRAQLAQSAPSGPLTVAAIGERYIEDRREEGKRVERMEYNFMRLNAHLGHMRPSDITKQDCNAYAAARRADGVKDATIWTEMTTLRSALNFAVNMGWIASAPYIRAPQKGAPRDHHLTKDEARALLSAASAPHVRLFIALALATAGRMSAILELTWVRVDMDARRIYLRNPEIEETAKGRATVPINDWLLPALQEAREAALSPFVIEWAGGRVMSVKKALAAAARRAGVKCSAHVLRHTAAVWMAEAGVPMSEIAQYLGHRDSRTTERVYARYSPDYLQGAAKALSL